MNTEQGDGGITDKRPVRGGINTSQPEHVITRTFQSLKILFLIQEVVVDVIFELSVPLILTLSPKDHRIPKPNINHRYYRLAP